MQVPQTKLVIFYLWTTKDDCFFAVRARPSILKFYVCGISGGRRYRGKRATAPYEIFIFCVFSLIIQNLYGLDGKISIIVPYKLSLNLILPWQNLCLAPPLCDI